MQVRLLLDTICKAKMDVTTHPHSFLAQNHQLQMHIPGRGLNYYTHSYPFQCISPLFDIYLSYASREALCTYGRDTFPFTTEFEGNSESSAGNPSWGAFFYARMGIALCMASRVRSRYFGSLASFGPSLSGGDWRRSWACTLAFSRACLDIGDLRRTI